MTERFNSPRTILIEDIQDVLDTYIKDLKLQIPRFLEGHLTLAHCVNSQKRHLAKDFFRNPVNVLWAIPYFSIRKVLEIADKLGSELARTFLQRIPKAIRTDYQKEMERAILEDLYGFKGNSQTPRIEQELRSHQKFQECSPALIKNIVNVIEKEIRAEVRLQCTKQHELTDLSTSAIIFYLAGKKFGDSSLDLFGIGKKVASLWAKDEAVSSFMFGKTLGEAYYNFAPPAPTSKQIWISTNASILFFSLLSSIIGVLSYPIQNKLGFCRKQLDSLIEISYDKLILAITKNVRLRK